MKKLSIGKTLIVLGLLTVVINVAFYIGVEKGQKDYDKVINDYNSVLQHVNRPQYQITDNCTKTVHDEALGNLTTGC